ncbi:MAG: SoxR reducing system RseC family protein [Candidatus Desulfacyla sp.]
MPTNEGFVATLRKDGKAEVVIQPVSSGIPGASPWVNRHVCHCATEGSTLTIEALNRVGAEVGDYVAVFRDRSGLLRNAASLLGIPVMGLLGGIILAGFLTDGFSFRIAGGMIAMAASLFSGIGIGVLVFRRVSAGNPPVIEQIIEKGWKEGPLCSDHRIFSSESKRVCNACAGSFSKGPACDRNGH